MQASFYASAGAVSNAARQEPVLGWRLRYPGLAEGLAALIAEEKRFHRARTVNPARLEGRRNRLSPPRRARRRALPPAVPWRRRG